MHGRNCHFFLKGYFLEGSYHFLESGVDGGEGSYYHFCRFVCLVHRCSLSSLALILFAPARLVVGIDSPVAAYPSSKKCYVLDGIRLGIHVGWEPDQVSS